MKRTHRAGFTLIEVLIVIAIIAILAAVVIVAINPGRQFKQANNSTRWSHANTILDATHQHMVDNRGIPPSVITTTPTEICKEGGVCTGLIDLSVLTAGQRYMVNMPSDPVAATSRLEWTGTAYINSADPAYTLSTTNGTGYKISKTAFDRIIVTAPVTELLNETPPYNGGIPIEVRR